ncbi:MAG TPA: (d)CMP kinase [Candidatus Saccharimonadales bacterium]
MVEKNLPKLITFDGEARSGKGTIVQATKDYLRDESGYKVMLIDAGQVFRVLVVAATRAGINLDDQAAIDEFLADEAEVERCVELVKQVYRMSKDERDNLLYTNEVGANSAKIGARPLSQAFKDDLLKKWLKNAQAEGYEIVLLDGRALEEVGNMLENEGLCSYILGLYFICNPEVGARRTLGYANKEYNQLDDTERAEVDELAAQIKARNAADAERTVQPIVRPAGAKVHHLPEVITVEQKMHLIDTSAKMSKVDMSRPIEQLVAATLK